MLLRSHSQQLLGEAIIATTDQNLIVCGHQNLDVNFVDILGLVVFVFVFDFELLVVK